MSDLTLSRIGDLLRSVIELLWTKPEGLSAREILAFLPEMTALTEYEAGYPPASNIPRYERIIRLATIPLVRAGWLIKSSKGRWILTEAGRKACRKYPNAQELYTEANQIYEASKKRLPSAWMA
jgi:restriction endonuclease Mrr